jgi:hypothetical protein
VGNDLVEFVVYKIMLQYFSYPFMEKQLKEDKNVKRKTWLKYRGYLHLTNKILLQKENGKIDKEQIKSLKKKVCNPTYVAQHAFFPLLHYKDKQRRYKKQFCKEIEDYIRKHKDISKDKSTAKIRPIHFATHIDAHIYAYYKDKLSAVYEKKLSENPNLDNCVLAYRQIPQKDKFGNPIKRIIKENGKPIYVVLGKSTIHFANEIFEEITSITTKNGSCVVLTFDVEKFFSSLHHRKLKKVWLEFLPQAEINDKRGLNDDHYNVFKAVTKFSYIDIKELQKGRGLDEQKLHKIREEGVNAFFKSPEEFRKAIKNREFSIYKNQYFYTDEKTNKKEPCGIPQGLPISAVLANMYMYCFDNAILKFIGDNKDIVYRRYSDDILIICNENNCDEIKEKVKKLITNQKLKLSEGKTEKFIFKSENNKITVNRYDINLAKYIPNSPLTYLGFEFYGYKTLIKSANISKFYRRIKQAINAKKRVIARLKEKRNTDNVELYTKDFYKLLTTEKPKPTQKKLTGRKNRQKANDKFGNFPHYVYKAHKVFKSKEMLKQIRNRYKFLRNELAKFD